MTKADELIRVSPETKARLEELQREDESADDVLERVLDGYPVTVGGWDDEEAEKAMKAIERSRKSFERATEENGAEGNRSPSFRDLRDVFTEEQVQGMRDAIEETPEEP